MTTIPTVADDEIIETAWGNLVGTEINKLSPDSGWLAGTVAANFSGSFSYRQYGPVVSATWTITRTGSNLTGSSISIATIVVVASRPAITIYAPCRITAPADTLAGEITSAGVLQFTALYVNTSGIIRGSATWLVP